MDGKSLTTIQNPVSIQTLPLSKQSFCVKQTGEIKDFVFDYSYWSHDGFQEELQPGDYLRP